VPEGDGNDPTAAEGNPAGLTERPTDRPTDQLLQTCRTDSEAAPDSVGPSLMMMMMMMMIEEKSQTKGGSCRKKQRYRGTNTPERQKQMF
jgi:hypothetical protein